MKPIAKISAGDLQDALLSDRPPEVIDVLTAEAFRETHIRGAENFCVYETAFVPNIVKRFPDQKTLIVVYGASRVTREAEVAAEKLLNAGYGFVLALDGGFDAWRQNGGAIENGPSVEVAKDSGVRAVDAVNSVIYWTGRNLFNHHTGTIRVAGGNIELRDGAFIRGEIVIDTNSIACTDLVDPQWNAMLIRHLRADDFFAVDRFPTATFVFEKIEPIRDSRPGIPNFQVSGQFTLRGITRPLAFSASISRRSDGTYTAQTFIEFDRTDWGVLYGSSRFFARLSEHVVNDHIHLHLKIATRA